MQAYMHMLYEKYVIWVSKSGIQIEKQYILKQKAFSNK
mgnify:CR=1 FL=1